MDRAHQQLFLLFILLVFYCLGPIWVLVECIRWLGPGNEIENTTLIKVLSVLATNPGAYTSVIHQMIVPVVAAVTAANYSEIFKARGQQWLFVLPLLTIFVCLADAMFVSIMSDSFKLDGLDGKETNASGAVSQLFLSTASTLSVYVMLLVGLKVGGKE